MMTNIIMFQGVKVDLLIEKKINVFHHIRNLKLKEKSHDPMN